MPELILLYDDVSTPVLRVSEIAEYLTENLGLPIEVRGDFLLEHRPDDVDRLARTIAQARVRDVNRPFAREEPAYGEVMFEARLLDEPGKRAHGVLYDGHRLQRLLRELLPEERRSVRELHVVFTSRLFGTFGEDGRYHARVNVCGFPSIVSTSGIVEAPAKPREFYVLKQQYVMAGEDVPTEALKERFAGQFIDYDDERMTEVLKGYALQCAVYAITGESFCDDGTCRLYNAHWQSEVLRAQLEGGGICDGHRGVVGKIRGSVAISDD